MEKAMGTELTTRPSGSVEQRATTALARLEAELVTMPTDQQARQAVAVLVAKYPQRGEVDEAFKLYLRELRVLFSRYPTSVVMAVIDPQAVIGRNPAFLPSVPEVTKALDARLFSRSQMLNAARQTHDQLAERRKDEAWVARQGGPEAVEARAAAAMAAIRKSGRGVVEDEEGAKT